MGALRGVVQYEIDVPLSRLVRMIGRDRWMLTRWGIPDRPASITPYVPASITSGEIVNAL